jgi:PhnB protein
MAARLNPYLTFGNDARAAMEFYRDVFGGELAINTFGDFGHEGPDRELVMHSNLETPSGFTIMASDTPEGMERATGTAISVSLSGDDADALRGYWAKLSADGTVTMPLEKQVWGDEFGTCTDRFGVPWLVNITGGQS